MTSHSNYRPDIDGLRAISILLVLFYHAHIQGFQGGFVGVDVFFVISGFLITQHLLGELESTGTIALKRFYARRIKRLFPAILAVVLGTILLWSVFLLGVPTDTNGFVRSIFYSMFGIANLFFKNNTGGYFDSRSEEMPLLHFWSLSVEEQFYLFFPASLLVVVKLLPRWGIQLTVRKFLMAVTALSFLLSCYFALSGKVNRSFYLMPLRAWELGAGCLLAIYVRQTKPLVLKNLAYWPLAILGYAGILVPAFMYDSRTIFPGLSAMPPVLGTVVLLLIHETKSGILSNRLSIKIGLLSYGVYLWHWPLLSMAQVWNTGEIPALSTRLVTLLLSLVLAELTLRFVEMPLRKSNFIERMKPHQLILSGLLSSVFIVTLAHGIPKIESIIFSKQLTAFTTHTADRNTLRHCQKAGELKPEACTIYPKNMGTSVKHIFVWGDSHAYSYFPIFEKHYSRRDGVTLTLLTVPRSLPLVNIADYERTNSIALKAIAKAKGEKIVILVGRWGKVSGEQTISSHDGPGFLAKEVTIEGTIALFQQSLQSTISKLAELQVKKILVFTQFPEFRYNPLRCKLRGTVDCSVTFAELEKYMGDVDSIITTVAQSNSGVRVFYPRRTICDTDPCEQFQSRDGDIVPMVRDENHPSSKALDLIEPSLREHFDWIGQ